MTVKVKPLVWEHHPAGCLGSTGGIGASYIVDTRAKDGSAFFVKGIHPSPSFDTLEAAKAAAQADYEARIIAALEPQHDALALVAAAYRDAAAWLLDMRAVDDNGNETTPEADVYVTLINSLPNRTPADAEAHLTALLRAEYERGVREAAGVMDTYLENARIGQASVVRALEELAGWLRGKILALLTQEGR